MLEIGVLGPLRLMRDGLPVSLNGPKPRALLAALAVDAGSVVSRDRLIDALWGESPPASAQGTLHTHLTHLRTALEPDRDKSAPATLVATVPGGYELRLDQGALDASRFEALAAEGRRALASGDPLAAAEVLRSALGLWRGRAYEGYDHEEFARPEAVRLEQQRMSALEDRIEADLQVGRHSELVGELESLVDKDPLRERLWGFLMVALYASGRQADALRAFQRVRRVLGDELGVEPGRELQDLELRILQQDADLDAPAGESTPAAAIEEPGPVLPLPLTSFVGRHEEMAHVGSLIAGSRLVTLTGPGGVGKSRLALEVARRIADGGDTMVHHLDVSTVERDDLVAGTAAAAVGAREEPGRPLVDSIARSLASRPSLLVIDNAESVLSGTAALARELGRRSADMRILTTSRAPLGVEGEMVVPLRPLTLPAVKPDDSSPLLEGDAIRLFSERAAAASPGFEVDDLSSPAVVEICTRVDGMPLAIELVTARLRVLSLDDVGARLDDFFSSNGPQRTPAPTSTLPELLEWSYVALTEDERALADRLAAFSGSFTLEMAESMVSGVVPVAIVPDLIEALVQRSLVYIERGRSRIRYRMLDMFRRHVWAKVASRGEGDIASLRHAELLADIAEEIEEAFGSPDWLDLIRTLDSDHDLEREQSNFRRALDWAISTGATGVASRLVGGLARYWRWRGRFEECRDWVDAVLAMAPEEGTEVPRAKVLREAAGLARQTGRWEDANRLATEAAALFSASGDTTGVADCLYDLGWGALLIGDFGTAERLFTESVELWEQTGDTAMASFPLVSLAWVHKTRGDLDGAEQIWDRAIGGGETLAARTGVTFWKADLAIDQGDLDAAEETARASLAAASKLGFAGYASGARYVLARVALLRGDLEGADALLEGAISDARREASVEVVSFAMRLAVDVALEAADIPQAQRRLDEFVALVGSLGGHLGTAALAELRAGVVEASDPELAAALLAGAGALRTKEALPLARPDQARYDARAERIRAVLGATLYEHALRRGREMSIDDLADVARGRAGAARPN